MLKPHDIVVMINISLETTPWTYAKVAHSLEMSPSEVHYSVQRAIDARLAYKENKHVHVNQSTLVRFIQNGVAIAFYATLGALVRGVPTAYAAPPLNELMISDQEYPPVWPCVDGEVMGQSLEPLHKSVPKIAHKNPQLYEALALVDAIRIGNIREQKLASTLLEKCLIDDYNFE